MHYAAGVLPICWIDAQTPLFLVGKDVRDGTWSDFGGKCEKMDKDVASTAAREFWEETCGALMDMKTARSRLVPGACVVLEGATQNRHQYWSFLIEVPFVPHLRDAFAKQLAFLKHRNMHRAYVEKTDVVYVDLDMMLSDAFPKRGVFHATITQHRQVLQRIAGGGMGAWKELCADYIERFPS
jgi:hypothetical protein